MSRRPIIGITPNYEKEDRIGFLTDLGAEDQDWNYIAGDYMYMTEKCGGVPIVIPIESTENIDEILSVLDGIIISGGSDVDPSLYGEEPHEKLGKVNIGRDIFEDALIKKAVAMDMPVLGICRGIQAINVAIGGTLYQDVKSQLQARPHSKDDVKRNLAWHEVHLKEGSRIREIFGKGSIMTNSFHHQAVKVPGEGAVVTGTGPDDIAEVLEMPDKRFVVAVQWHPEMMFDSEEQLKLCRAFVESCKK